MTDSDYRAILDELRRLARKIDGVSGLGVRHTRTGIHIGQPPRPPPAARGRAGTPASLVLVKVTGFTMPADFPPGLAGQPLGGGKYYGRILSGVGNYNENDTNFQLPGDFTIPDEDDCLFINLNEQSDTLTHAITLNTYHWGWDIGETTEATGKRVIFSHTFTITC